MGSLPTTFLLNVMAALWAACLAGLVLRFVFVPVLGYVWGLLTAKPQASIRLKAGGVEAVPEASLCVDCLKASRAGLDVPHTCLWCDRFQAWDRFEDVTDLAPNLRAVALDAFVGQDFDALGAIHAHALGHGANCAMLLFDPLRPMPEWVVCSCSVGPRPYDAEAHQAYY